LRAREHPTVSTPITWDEVEQALKTKDPRHLVFEAKDVLARVEKMGDLFEPVQKLKQKLPDLRGLGAGPEEDEEEKGGAIATETRAKKKTKPKIKTKGKSALKRPKL
jgi:bifunctional non-homologous end joining protein LigD